MKLKGFCNMYMGKYYLGNMSESTADMLLSLRNECSVVTSLKHMIYDVSESMRKRIISSYESYEKENGSLDGFVEPEGIKRDIGTLRDEQTIGTAYMYYAESMLLGDSVGMGKTVEVAALINVLTEEYRSKGKEFRCCFLTEKTSVGQIRDKLIRHTGAFVGLLESGEQTVVDAYLSRNKDKRYYNLVGPQSLLENSAFLIDAARRPYDMIVIDETYILKNTASNVYTCVKNLFKYTSRRIILNASPVELIARDFYNQLALLDADFLPTVGEFNKTYLRSERTRFGFEYVGAKDNIGEFREAISLRYLARTRKTEGAIFEDNTGRMICVPLSEEQKMLTKKSGLYQLTTDYPTGVDKRVEFNVKTTPKLDALLYILQTHINVAIDGAFVYCRFVECHAELQRILQFKGYRACVINGKTPQKQRLKLIDSYNAGEYNVLISNIKRGLDLQVCNHTIMYSIDSNPQSMIQAEGRMTREFDIIGKNLWMLVSMGRELKALDAVITDRVRLGIMMANADKNLVTDTLLNKDCRLTFEDLKLEDKQKWEEKQKEHL